MIKLKLTTCGLEFKASGETIEECLDKVGLSWNDIKNKGVITVKKGTKTHEHLFSTLQLKRIFGNKLTKGLWSKRLETLLDNE
jgi:hypothetical protein